MANITRTVETLSKLDLGHLNRILQKLQLDVNQLQGRIGKVTIQDSLDVSGDLSVGGGTITDGLLATLEGFTERPVAPWIPHAKDLTDNTVVNLLSLTPGTATSRISFGALVYYNIMALRPLLGTAVQGETGLVTCTGVGDNNGLITSGVSIVAGASQAIVAGTLLNTFSSALSPDGSSLVFSVNANTSFPASTITIQLWVWPFGATLALL